MKNDYFFNQNFKICSLDVSGTDIDDREFNFICNNFNLLEELNISWTSVTSFESVKLLKHLKVFINVHPRIYLKSLESLATNENLEKIDITVRSRFFNDIEINQIMDKLSWSKLKILIMSDINQADFPVVREFIDRHESIEFACLLACDGFYFEPAPMYVNILEEKESRESLLKCLKYLRNHKPVKIYRKLERIRFMSRINKEETYKILLEEIDYHKNFDSTHEKRRLLHEYHLSQCYKLLSVYKSKFTDRDHISKALHSGYLYLKHSFKGKNQRFLKLFCNLLSENIESFEMNKIELESILYTNLGPKTLTKKMRLLIKKLSNSINYKNYKMKHLRLKSKYLMKLKSALNKSFLPGSKLASFPDLIQNLERNLNAALSEKLTEEKIAILNFENLTDILTEK